MKTTTRGEGTKRTSEIVEGASSPILERVGDGVFEKRLRALFDNTPYLILTVDFDGNMTSANAAALRTYGYSSEELGGLHINQLIDEKYLPLVFTKIEKRRQGSQNTTPYEILTRAKSGEERWVEVSTLLVRERGEPVEIQCIARDITAQKRAEASLEESERRFKETAELLPGVICEMDLTGQLNWVNHAALDVMGYEQEDFDRGVNIFDVIAEHDRTRAQQNFEELLSGESRLQTSYGLCRKDGTAIDMLINSAPLEKNGRFCGIRSCLLDITELRHAEQQVRKSEERFRKIFAESPVGIAIADGVGTIKDMNPAFAAMFGLDGEADRFGATSGVFELAEVDEDSETIVAQGLAVEGWIEVPTAEDDDRGEAPPESRFLRWHFTPLSPSEGTATELLVQVQDLTAEKVAEEERIREAQEETEKARMLIKNLREQITEKSTFHNMVSRSKEMKEIFDLLPQVAETDVTVLVWGESGTGKELVARSLHELSPRKDKPFVAINCSALPDTLLESELFGYKAGAFTDAKKDKPGKFALAERGTLFLDEIGDISPAMQVKLLRVLQEKSYEPLGGTKSVKADVRVIAATNKNLKEMVKEGTFRQDLFYRINVLNIRLPSLGERKSDIPLLCDHFIKKFNAQYGKEVNEVSKSALEALIAYDFPGNIRELENVLEHAFVFCKGPVIGLEHLPRELKGDVCVEETRQILANVASFADLERLYLQSILAETNGNKIEAAKRLGVHKTTFFRKLKKLGIPY